MTTESFARPMSLRHVGKYEVITTLGRGSMGVVYKAKDPEIGRAVAIKTLRSVFMGDDAAGQEALKRFRQESRSAGKLRHPNIVTIFEAGRTDSGSPYIVMEFIDGESLEEAIATRCPMHPKEILHYLSQVASAIDYAHSQVVIHRDIKPSNIIVDRFFRPHLLDFGVAKLSDTSLTPAGTVVGTPSYMSPEQIRGETLDGATDRFAFAVVAFELFTGKRPFPGDDFTTVVNNIIHKGPLTFAEVAIDLPPALEAVLHRALSKDKSERYETTMEFVNALAAVFDLRVDDIGLHGGFRPEMREEQIGSIDYTAKMKAPTAEQLAQHPAAGDSSAQAAAGAEVDSDTTKKETVVIEDGAGGKRSMLPTAIAALLMLGVVGGGAFFALTQESPDVVLQPSSATAAGANTASSADDEPEPSATPSDASTIEEPKVTKPPKKTGPLAFLSFDPEPVAVPSALERSFLDSLGDGQLAYLFSQTSLPEKDMLELVKAAGDKRGIDFTRLLAFASKNSNFRVRIQALKSLSSSPHVRRPDAEFAVVERLGDEDFLVRGFAAKILGSIQTSGSLQALEARLKVEENEKVKAILKRSIGVLERAGGLESSTGNAESKENQEG